MEHSNREKIKKIKTSQSRNMLSRKDNKSKPQLGEGEKSLVQC